MLIIFDGVEATILEGVDAPPFVAGTGVEAVCGVTAAGLPSCISLKVACPVEVTLPLVPLTGLTACVL